MKKTSISLGLGMLMSAGAAQAAFLEPGTTGNITITGGCFAFGDCIASATGAIVDTATLSGTNNYGTSVGGDGIVGSFNFTVGADGNAVSITSFQQDSYLNTPGGTFGLAAPSTAAMSANIADDGSMTMSLEGRQGQAANFQFTIGIQNWNIDTHGAGAPGISPGTGLWDTFTTGSDSAFDPNTGAPVATQSGSALTGGGGTWTGTLISYGNVGSAWALFDGTPYSEVFNITVTGTECVTGDPNDCTGGGGPVIPIPAAVWLFGSGLLGLVGVARRKKAAA